MGDLTAGENTADNGGVWESMYGLDRFGARNTNQSTQSGWSITILIRLGVSAQMAVFEMLLGLQTPSDVRRVQIWHLKTHVEFGDCNFRLHNISSLNDLLLYLIQLKLSVINCYYP